MTPAILSLGDLQVHFAVRGPFNRRIGSIKAVDGVSFDLMPGEVFGLVGESGCGKSTLGKAIMGIHQPTAGEIWFEGQRIDRLAPAARRAVRRSLQYAYQDPGRVARSALEDRPLPARAAGDPQPISTRRRATRAFAASSKRSGCPTRISISTRTRFPAASSGGSALRASSPCTPRSSSWTSRRRASTCRCRRRCSPLFRGLRETFDLTYMLISHDLAVIRTMCSRVAVMYLGRIVESGPTEAIFDRPRHPYTRSLVAAIPKIGGVRVTRDFWLQGEPPCSPRTKILPSARRPVRRKSGRRKACRHMPRWTTAIHAVAPGA